MSKLFYPHAPKIVLATLMLGGANSALAEKNSTTDSLFGEKTEVSVGLGAVVAPRYMGADKYETAMTPYASIKRGIFFADSERGLGLQWTGDSGFSISTSIGHDYGRSTKNNSNRGGSKDLQGMGTVGGSTILGVTLEQRILPWLYADAEVEFRTGGEKRGNQYRVGLESLIIDAERDVVGLDFNIHAGDARYNQTYFGVTPEQSQNSRFETYKGDGGIYAYSAALSWQHIVDENWSTFTSLSVAHYADQAGRSPLVAERNNATFSTVLVYSF